MGCAASQESAAELSRAKPLGAHPRTVYEAHLRTHLTAIPLAPLLRIVSDYCAGYQPRLFVLGGSALSMRRTSSGDADTLRFGRVDAYTLPSALVGSDQKDKESGAGGAIDPPPAEYASSRALHGIRRRCPWQTDVIEQPALRYPVATAGAVCAVVGERWAVVCGGTTSASSGGAPTTAMRALDLWNVALHTTAAEGAAASEAATKRQADGAAAADPSQWALWGSLPFAPGRSHAIVFVPGHRCAGAYTTALDADAAAGGSGPRDAAPAPGKRTTRPHRCGAHTAVTARGPRLYLFGWGGGDNDDAAARDLADRAPHCFDVTARAWLARAPRPHASCGVSWHARDGMATCVLAGRYVFLIGGRLRRAAGGGAVAADDAGDGGDHSGGTTVQVLDAYTDHFLTDAIELPSAAAAAVAAHLDGDPAGAQAGATAPAMDVIGWRHSTPPLPRATSDACAVVWRGHVYVLGGQQPVRPGAGRIRLDAYRFVTQLQFGDGAPAALLAAQAAASDADAHAFSPSDAHTPPYAIASSPDATAAGDTKDSQSSAPTTSASRALAAVSFRDSAWVDRPDMWLHTARVGHAVHVVDDALLVVGGLLPNAFDADVNARLDMPAETRALFAGGDGVERYDATQPKQQPSPRYIERYSDERKTWEAVRAVHATPTQWRWAGDTLSAELSRYREGFASFLF